MGDLLRPIDSKKAVVQNASALSTPCPRYMFTLGTKPKIPHSGYSQAYSKTDYLT